MNEFMVKPVAYIHTDFKEKFGIPRQSGRAPSLTAEIIFTTEYRNPDALRGIQDFSHLWLIFDFSKAHKTEWSPTVRPPRLGGNTRVGVFASRSPFRPNNLGLSAVKIIGLEQTAQYGTVIHVAGADLMDGTPIFDIKPYIPYSDCHADASGGFTDTAKDFLLEVHVNNDAMIQKLPESKREALLGVLSHDPRPSYQNDPDRIYGISFSGYNIRFYVQDNVLTIIDIQEE